MSGIFAADLPRPTAGRLNVYLLGPGVGESQVVVFPDAKCMVVDGCAFGGVNLPEALLDHLGISMLDALVLTHPDLDHLRGMAAIVRRFQPRRIFRYPANAYVRELIAGLRERSPTHVRYAALADAMKAFDDYADEAGVHAVTTCAMTRPWAPAAAPYKVHFLAPTPFDQDRIQGLWRNLIDAGPTGWRLSRRFDRIMRNEARLGDSPNAMSLGVVIEWGTRRVLLSGDIENGKRSGNSGWKGVLRILDDPDDPRGHLVDDVDLVKVAHHGSKGAFFAPAWARHAKSKKTAAMIAPFSMSRLPADATLVNMRSHCAHLGLTSNSGSVVGRAVASGWKKRASPARQTTAPCIAAVLDESGGLALFNGRDAALLDA